jgi:beta-lactam-binding protein with PASTA domain
MVVVPDFRARLASERSLIAVQAGVRTRCHSTTLQPTGDGIVVGQDPPAGTVVRRDTVVVLTVMHAPADVER